MANLDTAYPCLKCHREVIDDAIECFLCEKWCHRLCAKLSKTKLVELSKDYAKWYCIYCSKVFPFQSITDEDILYETFYMNDSVKNVNLCIVVKR